MALKQLEILPLEEGIDSLQKALAVTFSEPIVASACNTFASSISRARDMGTLSVVPGIGLSTSSNAIKIPRNTFYGKKSDV